MIRKADSQNYPGFACRCLWHALTQAPCFQLIWGLSKSEQDSMFGISTKAGLHHHFTKYTLRVTTFHLHVVTFLEHFFRSLRNESKWQVTKGVVLIAKGVRALTFLNSTNTWKARSLPNMSEKHICIKLCLHQLQKPMGKKAGQEGCSLRKGDALNQTSCNRPHHVGGHTQRELGTSRRDLTVQLYFPAQRSLLSASQPNTVSGPDKSATKIPTLPATTTQRTWCVHNFFLTSSYQIQPAPFPTKWIGKQTNTSLTEQHCKSKLRTQMTPTKESGGWKFSSSSHISHWRKRGSHKQTNPLENWLSAKQWAGERGDTGFPQEFLSESSRRIWMQACAISYLSNDPLWPLVQLVSLSPNALIAEIWEPRMQQRGQSINLPQETSGQQHVSLTLGQNWKRWNLWFGLNASCGLTIIK